jgi:hypothetical protein
VAQGTTSWSATFGAVPTNTLYTPVATAVDNDGLEATVTGPAVQVGTPTSNAPPSASITRAEAALDCVTMEGAASDPDGTITEVAVELGSRPFRPAVLSQDAWRYQECRIPAGSYTVRVRATDDRGATGFATGPVLQVESLQEVTGTWQEHQAAGRLRFYRAPCRNIGFGTCDAGFPQVFQTRPTAPHPFRFSAGWAAPIGS